MSQPKRPHDESLRELSGMVLPAVAELNRLADRWLEERLRLHDVSLAEFRIVGALLGEQHGLSQRDLAQRLGVRPATVSGALPRLEQRGLVERLDNPNDARAKLVRLCETEKSMTPITSLIAELDTLLFGQLPGAARSHLRQALTQAINRFAPGENSS